MRTARAWWQIFRAVGGGMRAGRQGDALFRYFVLKSLDHMGLFQYLDEPRSYGEILSRFSFVDGAYTQDVLGTIVNDSKNVIRMNSEQYERNPDEPIPNLDDIMNRTDPRIQPMVLMAESMSGNILDRMTDHRVDLPEVFEREENKVVNMFHELLGKDVYSKIRSGVFAYLPRKELAWMRGKKFLDIGCGSGKETAEIWLMFDGDIQITAIDPVPSMIQLASENFERFVAEIEPEHPLVSDVNKPVFEEGSATNLPYADDTFDVSFWAVMLHWTSDPRKAIQETIRVVKPGGLIIGSSAYKPYVNPYTDLVVRSSRNSYGFYWKEDFINWFEDEGLRVEMATPAGIFRVINTPDEMIMHKSRDSV
jgi:ubiquinone/menaquinone biosynthesis C-methylase UbiE